MKPESTIKLSEALASSEFIGEKSPLVFVVGTDDNGRLVTANMADLPHLVIAGATGMGKSSFAHEIILSIIKKASPDEVKFILFDTKVVEFASYASIPHLCALPMTDKGRIVSGLQWLSSELQRRLRLFADKKCRNIQSYNDYAWENYEQELPRIVAVIDDAATIAELEDVKSIFQRLGQNGRIAGIHLVLITQSPPKNCISEVIKSCIPARAIFRVMTKNEEKLLLDSQMKEPISEIGTMYFWANPGQTVKRIRCCWVYDDTITNTVEEIKEKYPQLNRNQSLSNVENNSDEIDEPEDDDIFRDAVDVIMKTGQASVAILQRELNLGYAHSARLVDEMEEKGIVGPFRGSKPRQILITKKQWETMCKNEDFSPTIANPEESTGENRANINSFWNRLLFRKKSDKE